MLLGFAKERLSPTYFSVQVVLLPVMVRKKPTVVANTLGFRR